MLYSWNPAAWGRPTFSLFSKFFGKYGKIMTDDTVATATLSRLLHHAHIVSGDSYRMEMGVVDFL